MQLLIFFDAFGFNSGASKLSSNKITCSIYLFHVLSAILFTISSRKFIYMYAYDSSFSAVEAVNSAVQYCAPLFTYWLVIFEAHLQRHSHKRFWEISQQIEYGVYGVTHYSYTLLSFKCKLIEFCVLPKLFIIIHYYIIEYFDLLSLAYIYLAKFCQIRVFYFMYCLEIVQMHLEHLEHKIENLQNILIQTHFTPLETNVKILSESVNSNSFRRIREIYNDVFELASLLNKVFGWSQASAVLFCFYFLMTDLNYVSLYFQNWTAVKSVSELIHRF